MGFFSLKATCAICGKEVGLNRFQIGTTVDGKEIWKCPACTKKGGYLAIDYNTGKVTLHERQSEAAEAARKMKEAAPAAPAAPIQDSKPRFKITWVHVWIGIIILAIFMYAIAGSSDGGSSSNETVTCGYCDRVFKSDSANGRSISRRNLCENCYNNMKQVQDALDEYPVN